MISNASLSPWKANCHEILADAQSISATVHLECCLVWCGEPTCMTVDGVVREVNGREARLIVLSMTLQPYNPKAEINQGKFYLSVKRHITQDMTARVGVYGTANVLETVIGPGDVLVCLSLRFSRNISIRQLRNSKRILWCGEYSRMASVLLAHNRPATCNELRNLLGEAPPTTQIQDVSEGGACVCIPEELALLSFTLDTTYLFFLQPSIEPAEQPPYVFFAKRVGFGKAPEAGNIAIRLRFLDELDWSVRRTRLTWLNVKGGSSRLRQCLTKYVDTSQDQ